MAGWSYGQEFDKARKAGLFNAQDNSNDEANLDMLVHRRLDGVIAISSAAEQIILKRQWQTIVKPLQRVIDVLPTHLAFARGKNADILMRFNQTLQRMHDDGTLTKLVEKNLAALPK